MSFKPLLFNISLETGGSLWPSVTVSVSVWQHCSQMGPHLGTRVPMGTFFSLWVPIGYHWVPIFYFKGSEREKSQCSHRLMLTI